MTCDESDKVGGTATDHASRAARATAETAAAAGWAGALLHGDVICCWDAVGMRDLTPGDGAKSFTAPRATTSQAREKTRRHL